MLLTADMQGAEHFDVFNAKGEKIPRVLSYDTSTGVAIVYEMFEAPKQIGTETLYGHATEIKLEGAYLQFKPTGETFFQLSSNDFERLTSNHNVL